jgi:hypothetical protein
MAKFIEVKHFYDEEKFIVNADEIELIYKDRDVINECIFTISTKNGNKIYTKHTFEELKGMLGDMVIN